jgi:hypothetical protein
LTAPGEQGLGTICVFSGLPHVFSEFLRGFGILLHTTEDALRRAGDQRRLDVTFAVVGDPARARNGMAADAADTEFALFLDCDQVPPPDLFLRFAAIMSAPDLPERIDVLTALYFTRQTHRPVIYRWAEDGNGKRDIQVPVRDMLFPVDCCGAGALMVRTSVFARMRAELGEEPFDNLKTPDGGQLMEDLSFCRRCERLGVRVWCDPTVVSEHLDVTRVGYAQYDAMLAAQAAAQ